jgi:hypothetical protein
MASERANVAPFLTVNGGAKSAPLAADERPDIMTTLY